MFLRNHWYVAASADEIGPDINLVKQNALKLAQIAKAAGLPTILTSSMEDWIQGPLVPELAEILADEFAARIRRPDARSCS